MGERRLAMGPQSDDAPRDSHVHRSRRKFLGSRGRVFPQNCRPCVRPIEAARVGGISEGLDLMQFFQALVELVEWLKFQRARSFRSRNAGDMRKSAEMAQYSDPVPKPS